MRDVPRVGPVPRVARAPDALSLIIEPPNGDSGDQNQNTSHRFTQFMWSIVGKSYRISKNSI